MHCFSHRGIIPHMPMSTEHDRYPTNKAGLITTMPFAEGQEVVITIKMDGEAVTINKDEIGHGQYQVKDNGTTAIQFRENALRLIEHLRIQSQLDKNEVIYAERMNTRKYSVYPNLESLIYGFNITFCNNGKFYMCHWDYVESRLKALGLPRVPVLYKGPYNYRILSSILHALISYQHQFNGHEGIVVRAAKEFEATDAKLNMAQFVKNDFHEVNVFDVAYTKNRTGNTCSPLDFTDVCGFWNQMKEEQVNA